MMQKYLDDPSLLMGADVDRDGSVVLIIKRDTRELIEAIECADADEAKGVWAELKQAIFAFGVTRKGSSYRQTFAFGEGQNARQSSTGWTKT